MPKTSDWWAPLWKGLVWDGEGKHYRKMKSAIWLFLYLIICADRQTGGVARKIKTISSHTGFGQEKIWRWLDVLRKKGYIETKNTGRCLLIQIKNWRRLSTGDENDTPEVSKMVIQKYQKCHFSNRFKWP